MAKFRIYSLIYGPILPIGKILGCEIQKMTFEEQGHRNFTPVQGVFKDEPAEEYKTYVTDLPYMDPMKIKTEYVAIYDIDENNENGAVGGAARAFDKLCRFLSIANRFDFKEKHGPNVGGLLPYVFQINKVYAIDAESNEKEVDFKLESGHIYLPNRPEANEWRDNKTSEFFKGIIEFHDEVLERSLKYLYRSAIGHLINDSPEKIALDHIKSIEIIVNALSKKQKFKERLDEAGQELGLSPEEKDEIIKFWENRSTYGDVAHPSKFDQTERYPNQFPIPSNVNYPGSFLGHITADICMKYYQYKKNYHFIEIEEPFEPSYEGTLSSVNPMWRSNHYCYFSSERNKSLLKKKVKQSFAEEMEIKESLIFVGFGVSRKEVILKVSYQNETVSEKT